MTSIDLACGNNKISPYFIGVDVRQTTDTQVVADVESLIHFADSSINIITFRRGLQHVSNDIQSLKEINRILTKDGIAIIEVASFWNAWVSKLLNTLQIKKHPYAVFHVYKTGDIKRKIALSGLHLVVLSSAPTMTPLFRNHLAVVLKGNGQQ